MSYLFEGGAAAWQAVRDASPFAWGCVLFLSTPPRCSASRTWTSSCTAIRRRWSAPFALLIPVSGLASGWLFLGESLAPMQAAGVALVLAGLVVNVYGARFALLFRRLR